MTYAEIPAEKKAFVFELDDVLFPAKDYHLQVYYLFANLLEYHEGYPAATDLVQFMKKVYDSYGSDRIFDKAKEVFAFEEKYRDGFLNLYREAKLPLKLLLYQNILTLLQEIIVDRKQVFIVTSGLPEQQLNKIRQTEWHGLEQFLKVYFTDEIAPKPDPKSLIRLMEENELQSEELLVIGCGADDETFAACAGLDYIAVNQFI